MTAATFATLLDELLVPTANGTGCVLTIERHGNSYVVHAHSLPLHAVLEVAPDLDALMRSADFEATLRELVDEKLRPFRDLLQRAHEAAIKAWEEELGRQT